MLNWLNITLQYLLPKYLISVLAGWIADRRAGWLTHWLIHLFIRYYKVDLQEAQLRDVKLYKSFNEFFIRRLHPDARPLTAGPEWMVSPVDGLISQFGDITTEGLLQAKGHHYHLPQLLAGDSTLVKLFQNGKFATIYLSPRDYHRVHMPCDGILQKMIYVPGKRFSVNILTTQSVPQLFARNERVITLFDTAFGPMVQILVGAMIVGSISVVWTGKVTSWTGTITHWDYSLKNTIPIQLSRGSEMGYFSLGSTVINLFANRELSFSGKMTCSQPIQLGEAYVKQG